MGRLYNPDPLLFHSHSYGLVAGTRESKQCACHKSSGMINKIAPLQVIKVIRYPPDWDVGNPFAGIESRVGMRIRPKEFGGPDLPWLFENEIDGNPVLGAACPNE